MGRGSHRRCGDLVIGGGSGVDSVGAPAVPGGDGLDDDAKERTAKPLGCSAFSGEFCCEGEGRLEIVRRR
jgi:hypothetical protein